MDEDLVTIKFYTDKIIELSVEKRIETNIPILVRKNVAKMLKEASDLLPRNIHLQIDSGYRSPKVQMFLWNNRIKELGNKKSMQLVGNPERYYHPLIQRYYYKIKRRIYKLINKVFNLKTNY